MLVCYPVCGVKITRTQGGAGMATAQLQKVQKTRANFRGGGPDMRPALGAARPQADGFPCGPSPQGEKVWEARAKDRWASSVRKFFPTGGISKRGASHQVAVMGISAGGHDGGQHQRSGQVKSAHWAVWVLCPVWTPGQ